MKILQFEDEKAWLEARLCRITGSRLESVLPKLRGSGKKIGYYELIAERIAKNPETKENAMDRGHRLEPEAIERFTLQTKKKVDTSLVMWVSDESESIAVSPDGEVVGTKEKAAVEVKCLNAARHIEVYLTKEVPSEYDYQVKQYFVVNPKLDVVYLCFYNPDLRVADFFIIEYRRENVAAELVFLMDVQKQVLEDVEATVNKLLQF